MPPLAIFDGHNDVLSCLLKAERDGNRPFFERTDQGHIDLPRAREGGFAGGLFSVYVGADPNAALPSGPVLGERDGKSIQMPRPLTLAFAQRVALAEMGILFRLERQSEGALQVVLTADDAERCVREGNIAAVVHFEGAEPIDARLDALEVFYRAGLRSLGPVWSRPNDFGEGVPFLFPSSPDTGPGLTDAGKALVRECNRMGILVDVSHVNERGFWDIAGLTDAPLVATHSNAHALTPVTRNLTDRQLDAIAESGGIVGVNFAVSFLREDGRGETNTPISRVVEHFRYLADRMGVDHVGFGSDLDGTDIPVEIGDVAGLPRLVAALSAAGFDDASLLKVAHENWLRVLKATWKSPASQPAAVA